MTQTTSDIKEVVQERYGALAERQQKDQEMANGCCGSIETSCCGPTNVSCGSDGYSLQLADQLYQAEELDTLPETVTNISLGCGNPTALASIKAGEVVLDLGSGGGIDCFIAAKAVGPTGRVIGVDMTDSMLALANQNKSKMGVTNVEFRKGEIENLPVENDQIDLIISNCVINLSPDKDAVFREAYRVLKPGGRLSVSDIVSEGHIPEALQANINAWAGCISGALDQADYLQRLQQAGFTKVEVQSRHSYGIENIDLLDKATQAALKKDVDWNDLPLDARLYSATIVAYKGPQRKSDASEEIYATRA